MPEKEISEKEILNEEEEDENSEEESELEEEIKEVESNIDNLKFIEQQNQITESTAPVLDPVQHAQEGPKFVRLENLAGGQVSGNNNNQDDSFKYTPREEGSEENARYTSASNVREDINPVDLQRVGRDVATIQKQGVDFVQSHSEVANNSSTIEKYVSPSRIDTTELGRKNPFETETRSVKKEKIDYKIK